MKGMEVKDGNSFEEVEDQYNDLGKYVRIGKEFQRAKLDCERKLKARTRLIRLNTIPCARACDQNTEKLSLSTTRLKSGKELYRYSMRAKNLREIQETGSCCIESCQTEGQLFQTDLVMSRKVVRGA